MFLFSLPLATDAGVRESLMLSERMERRRYFSAVAIAATSFAALCFFLLNLGGLRARILAR